VMEKNGGYTGGLTTTVSPGSVSARRSSATPDMTSATSRTRPGPRPSRSACRRSGRTHPDHGRVGVACVVARDRVKPHRATRQRQPEVHLGDPGRQHLRRIFRPLRAVPEPQELQGDVVERIDADCPRSASDVAGQTTKHGR
jgi:hypothetical protein